MKDGGFPAIQAGGWDSEVRVTGMANNQMDKRRRDRRMPDREMELPPESESIAAAEPPLRSRPANENDPGISMLLARLRRQPGYTTYYAAFALSLIWIFGWFLVFSGTIFNQPAPFARQALPETMKGLSVLLLPIGGFWILSYFLWRAQQMRHVSEVLLQSAVRLLKPQDIATEGLTSISQAVRSEVDLLVGGVEHAMQRATALEEIVHKEISAIERAFGSNEDRIRSLVTGLDNQRQALHQAGLVIGNETNQLLTRLENNTVNLDRIIGGAQSTLAKLEHGLKTSTEELAHTIDDMASRAAAAGNEIGGQSSQIERISGMLVNELRDFSQHLQGQIHTLSQVSGQLNAETASFGSNLEGMEGRVVQLLRSNIDQLTGIHMELVSAVDSSAHKLAGHINSSGSELLAGMDQTASALIAQLSEASGRVVNRLEDSSAQVHATFEGAYAAAHGKFTESTDRFHQLVTEATDQLDQRIDSSAERLFGSMNSTIESVTDKIDDATNSVYARLEQTASGVVGQLQTTGSNINELLVSTSGTIAAHLRETSDIVSREMRESGIALSQNIEGSGGQLTEKLISVSGEFVENLTKAREEMFGLLDNSSREMTSKLEATAARINDHVSATTGEVAEKVTAAGENLSALFNANTKMMTEQLERTSTDVTTTFAETAVRVTRQVTEANTLMAQRLETTATEVAGQLDQAGSSMFGRIDSTVRDLGQRFDVATELLEKLTGDISEGLGRTTLEITGRFEQETGLLVDRVDKAAKNLDTAATETSARLDEAHRKFAGHVETANVYLADQLSTAAGALDERLESISMQLTGKLEMTGTRISERLEDVSSLVEKSVDKFNDEMELVLNTRREALDKLIDDANRKAQEVDKVMSNYMSLIEESLASAEARSRDIAKVVAEQAQVAAKDVEEEISRLEASSGHQAAQAARVLREQHERALSAMNEMLSSTATDFQQTAQDMRITAQQVVKDIDAARNELKRAILDLPEETRANADSMRRVVADQIAALNALADVVKRQSGGLDLSGPGFSPPRSSRETGPGKSEGAAFSAPTNGTSGARKKNEERNGGQGSILASLGRTLSAAVAPASKRRNGDQTEAGSSEAGEELPREMDGLVHKLNGAARDLVEAVEGALPRELEKRYNAGETDVYTSRLFEGRGKRLEAVLADRYASERLVRTKVDAYVRLFERLLDTVSEGPRGAKIVEACLGSESGRIYVMLGEVSGRLPPQ